VNPIWDALCLSDWRGSTLRQFQVFFPLRDIAEDADGTQFWPGSHLSKREHEFWETLQDSSTSTAGAVAPACRAGDCLIFDYRILHRGLPNVGLRERPIGYAVLSTGGAVDRQNFDEHDSLWDTKPWPRDHYPDFRRFEQLCK
jgi:ectoine hydroxylase-related dioxygenase (phytanoyl-CoA dioxygenase family)